MTNTGSRQTSDVVQVYSSNRGSTYGESAPKRSLAGFAKVDLAPGQTQRVEIPVDSEALALWDVNADRLAVEPGTYAFEFGHSSSDISESVDVAVDGAAFASVKATEKPINVFDHSFAASDVVYYEASKANTARATRADELVGGYYAVGSRGAGSWTAVHDLDLTDARSLSLTVGSVNPEPVGIEVRTGGPTGTKIADLTVDTTGGTEYVIPATVDSAGDIPVKEIAYTTVSADLPAGLQGAQDVYLVFTGADVRVKDLSITPAVITPTAEVVVSAQCTDGRIVVTVTATNTSSVPVDLTITTPLGTKTIENVAAGTDVVKTFTSKAAAVLMGIASVTATATVDGGTATVTVNRALSGKFCK